MNDTDRPKTARAARSPEESVRVLRDACVPAGERLAALAALAPSLPKRTGPSGDSNNHIHTCYSFSPYTPTAAALESRLAGLDAAGSVDHDSIAAAAEMRRACEILGLGCVTGCEARVTFPERFSGRKINNPDSSGIAYMTIQGVPEPGRGAIDRFLAPIRARRIDRTDRMTQAADSILRAAGAEGLDFRADVLARSKAGEGGGITERHLLAAAASRIIDAFGRGDSLVRALEGRFGVPLPERQRRLLADPANPHLEYDMLGALKAGFLERIFIQPDRIEAAPVRDALAASGSAGAVAAYAYLGDVAESPTGDKKAEKFEDDFLPELFEALSDLGFPAVTYMPPRNTRAQLARVKELCARHDFIEISGVDINQPRQSFSCPELRMAEFRHLADSTRALVAHEALASYRPELGILSPENPYRSCPRRVRVRIYARAGLDMGRMGPGAIAGIAADLEKGCYG